MGQGSDLERFEQSLSEDMPLAPFTTLGIGGPAKYFREVTSAEQLAVGIEWARSHRLPHFILGGGSNVVIADSGFPGLVLRLAIRGIETRFEDDTVIITAGAGEDWDQFVAMCVQNNWAGVECLSGIPGRVGATPIQNVGAYGQETSETLVRLEALDLTTGYLIEMSADQSLFGYRTSRFKSQDRDRFIITSVSYRLKVNGPPAVRYSELERYLAEHGENNPSLIQVREAVLAIRRRKAMVIDTADQDSRSVGSFFVNPVVTRDEFQEIKERATRLTGGSEDIPAFPSANGHVKLSAAWLIERAGIKRGYVHGRVGTSTKHALAIINRGGGTAREVVELAEFIKSRVRDAFNITLLPEPVFVGFDL